MKITCLFLSLFMSISTFAQYPKAFVNQGEVTVNNRFVFVEGSSFDVRPKQKINMSESCILTCKRLKKIHAYSGDTTLTYVVIMDDLDNSRVSSDDYFENMFSGNYTESRKRYGSVDRALDSEKPGDYYYPLDSMWVISDSVKLEIGNRKTLFMSPLQLRTPSGEAIALQRGEQNFVIVGKLEPGEYHWGCEIELDGELLEFDNVFYVPDRKTSKRSKNELKKFTKNFSMLDSEWGGLIVSDWLYSKGYYYIKMHFKCN